MNARQTILDSIKSLQADRAKLVAEIANMPKSKYGTAWHMDREGLRGAITRQINTLINALNA